MPHPYIISMPQFEAFEQTALALNAAVKAFIHKWHENSVVGSRLREIVQLPAKIEGLFLNFAQRQQGTLPDTYGTMLPDFVMVTPTDFKICEINARFSLNGFLISAHINEAVRVQSATTGTLAASLCATAIPHTHSFIPKLLERLGCHTPGNNTIHVISRKESKRYDLALLQQILPASIKMVYIDPNDLLVISQSTKDASLLLELRMTLYLDAFLSFIKMKFWVFPPIYYRRYS